jgi:hypothetical protein
MIDVHPGDKYTTQGGVEKKQEKRTKHGTKKRDKKRPHFVSTVPQNT